MVIFNYKWDCCWSTSAFLSAQGGSLAATPEPPGEAPNRERQRRSSGGRDGRFMYQAKIEHHYWPTCQWFMVCFCFEWIIYYIVYIHLESFGHGFIYGEIIVGYYNYSTETSLLSCRTWFVDGYRWGIIPKMTSNGGMTIPISG